MFIIKRWEDLADKEKYALHNRRLCHVESKEITQTKKIIRQVRKKGDKALRAYSKKFDHVDLYETPLRVQEKEFAEAELLLSAQVKNALHFCIDNALKVQNNDSDKAETQKELRDGVTITSRSHPLKSVGLYVPHGKGSFPSMVYMQAVPAHIAGVPRIVMVTPPEKNGKINPACLYAAKISGVHEVYRIGGAHSIAALAYGTESIEPVTKILGPGSPYVSIAKHLVSLNIATGTITGPSESMIIADGSTDPQLLAHDLLIEAEHGKDALALLLCPDTLFLQKVKIFLEKLIQKAPEPFKTFFQSSLREELTLIKVYDLQEAMKVAEQFAPEHLLLHGVHAEELAPYIKNAGEILCGIPFSIANYALGANSILPTHGFSRSASALSVRDFQRTYAIIQATPQALQTAGTNALYLADYEQFYHHALALRVRNFEK